MKKQELKSMNDLYFRWWKAEVKTGKELGKELDKLNKQNKKLKKIAYENSP